MSLLQVHFFSEVLWKNVDMNVILPDLHTGAQTLDGRKFDPDNIPVMYLLHGLSDDYTSWIRQTSIERYAYDYGMAVVMPDCNIFFYTDLPNGTANYFTFISEEVPKYCHTHFAGITKDRGLTFVSGLSMGGYGALKLALSRPDVFSAVAAYSGAVDIHERTRVGDLRGNKYWDSIFGGVDKINGSENDLFALAQNCKNEGKMPRIYMWCGTEDSLFEDNNKLASHLQKLGYCITYKTSAGCHAWRYWDEQIQVGLRFLFGVKQ